MLPSAQRMAAARSSREGTVSRIAPTPPPVQTASGPYAGTFYDPAFDTQTYNAYLGAPRTYGLTLKLRY